MMSKDDKMFRFNITPTLTYTIPLGMTGYLAQQFPEVQSLVAAVDMFVFISMEANEDVEPELQVVIDARNQLMSKPALGNE